MADFDMGNLDIVPSQGGSGLFQQFLTRLEDPNVQNLLATAGAGFSQLGRGGEGPPGVGEILGAGAKELIRNKAFQEKTGADAEGQDDLMSQVLNLLKGGSKGFSDAKLGGPTKATIDGNQISLTGTVNPADTNEAQETASRASGTAGIDPLGSADSVSKIKAGQPGGTETAPFLESPLGDKRTSTGPFSFLQGPLG